MATEVSICTAALQLLGDAPIASLTEGTKRANLCNNIWSTTRDDVLRSHPWNCLQTRVALSPLAATPVGGGWGYQFSRPGDYLRLVAVEDEEGEQIDYEFLGNRVMADTGTIYLHYLASKDVSEWDSNLVNLMIRRMQLELAYPITKSTSLRDALRQEFYAKGVGVLAQAKSVDGQENPPEDWGDSPLIAVRG